MRNNRFTPHKKKKNNLCELWISSQLFRCSNGISLNFWLIDMPTDYCLFLSFPRLNSEQWTQSCTGGANASDTNYFYTCTFYCFTAHIWLSGFTGESTNDLLVKCDKFNAHSQLHTLCAQFAPVLPHFLCTFTVDSLNFKIIIKINCNVLQYSLFTFDTHIGCGGVDLDNVKLNILLYIVTHCARKGNK